MKLGIHKGKWFRLGEHDSGCPGIQKGVSCTCSLLEVAQERFLARFPTVDEKLAFSAVEAELQGANDKPGDPVPRYNFSKSMKAIYDATVPLIEGHETEGENAIDGDEVRAVLAGPGGGAFFEEVAALGAHIFRPTSEAGRAKPSGTAIAQGVSADAVAAEGKP